MESWEERKKEVAECEEKRREKEDNTICLEDIKRKRRDLVKDKH